MQEVVKYFYYLLFFCQNIISLQRFKNKLFNHSVCGLPESF